MNSTLKSLVFWMVLVVVGVLVWNFSTRFSAASAKPLSFSEFMTSVDSGQIARVTIEGMITEDRAQLRMLKRLAEAKHVDGVILVLEAERTKCSVAENVKERIVKNGGNILGVVFNKRRCHIPACIRSWLH